MTFHGKFKTRFKLIGRKLTSYKKGNLRIYAFSSTFFGSATLPFYIIFYLLSTIYFEDLY